jgi:3-hydroxy acid dehydrogenase/malonic semialdehyde reductase
MIFLKIIYKMKTKKPMALITGASSGIGKATALHLAKMGYNLVLCGRNLERLEEVASAVSGQVQVKTLLFNVANKNEVFSAIESLGAPFNEIDVLINNAGNAHGLDLFQDALLEDWDAMLDINVKGLLYVSKAVLPVMLAQKKGHIIHIGSTAGKEVYAKGNVYCASKHAVNAINESMRIDLNGTGIKVGAIHPGMVATSFSEVRFKGDQNRAAQVYKGFSPLQAQDVAETIGFMLSCPPHVNIADLVIMPTDQANSTTLHKVL